MFHPAFITRPVRGLIWLNHHRIWSFGLFPRSVIQIQAVPAPVGRALTHPYPWGEVIRAVARQGVSRLRPTVSRLPELRVWTRPDTGSLGPP